MYRGDVGRALAAALAGALLLSGLAAAAPLRKDVRSSPGKVAANGVTYQDAIGDSGFVPDIASVAVSNDNGGRITFRIEFANRPQFTSDDVVQVRIDADGAFYTGQSGFEYMLQVSAFGIDFLVDRAGTYGFGTGRLEASYVNGVLRLDTNVRDFADAAALRFYVAADSVSPSPGVYDWAPDGDALFHYVVNVPLLVDRWNEPEAAKAGATFTVSGVQTTNNAFPGSVRCTATVGARRLTGTGRWTPTPVLPPAPPDPALPTPGPYAYKATTACAFKLPKTAKRKVLRGTMTVTKDGVSVRRSFSARVA